MITILTGSLVLSLLHALIPNHWLPVIAIGRKEGWTLSYTTRITFIAGLSHAVSTVLLGWVLGLIGFQLSETVNQFTHIVAPVILVLLGIFFIYQHHHHKHFHIDAPGRQNKRKIILSLVVAMFFSPCLEIEGYFLMAGSYGTGFLVLLTFVYMVVTILGMISWVRVAYSGILKINWHKIEHNAGIITGVTLILTGIISFYVH
ncbi:MULTISPECIES: hypothetical protein [Xanthocytophaga]|uniref:Urease accessory protein UreH-like transmembrane domain-containing protein n=2 Tax=Xanthocytophaga TaxID=3078918 RepID=A0AAE3QS59_9BACT|nr:MULTISPECIES: hypothetical protein [Xanthocytophaga]MDJ1471575.1 hypothetical protein [Xanthocytophaga flavus]MDJ1482231.1 hypothetical protein [Xanthocytophaga flavus]MDJ1502801.1 hypothetical protein [Xanthocytophaga agilis]